MALPDTQSQDHLTELEHRLESLHSTVTTHFKQSSHEITELKTTLVRLEELMKTLELCLVPLVPPPPCLLVNNLSDLLAIPMMAPAPSFLLGFLHSAPSSYHFLSNFLPTLFPRNRVVWNFPDLTVQISVVGLTVVGNFFRWTAHHRNIVFAC
ncbi:hypothetical protein QN277_026089 [Acacia crassicarpa]|uniref:Uncharacterized protein n=1 Tax=Acacia crassicarpa TaxID=499986 RepID=A0AAE1J8L4_9FABA|nr:hypothetical protein QN277_026089 [Acacia crassicarpa]